MPSWLENSLRSLAYSIGYQHSLYPHYNLPELAICAELIRLVHFNLPDKLLVKSEVQYSAIGGLKMRNIRADIVVFEKTVEGKKCVNNAKSLLSKMFSEQAFFIAKSIGYI